MTLLVGLILLVILTVISLVGFRNVTMTERMAGNSADRNVSFQSSESAGKEALQAIATSCAATPLTAQCGLTGTGYFATALAEGANTGFWTGVPPTPPSCAAASTPFNWANCAKSVDATYARNSQAAQYVIEFLVSDIVAATPYWRFRVTTRSTGGSGDAEVVLQTIYTHVNP